MAETSGLGAGYSPSWWWIVWTARDRERWWDWLSPRWARHVACYGYSIETDTWLVVNPGETRLGIFAVPDHAFGEMHRQWRAKGCLVVRVPVGPDAGRGTALMQNCATTVARVAGIRGRAWRPVALLRTVLRGEHEVVEDTHACLSKLKPRKKILRKLLAAR